MIRPDDAEYDTARATFYGGTDRRPAAIVRVANAADVSRVIAFARESGMELAVRSGGHSGAGHSVSDGGIVLDLKDMKALEIDAERRAAWAETGLTAVEYTIAADAHGLATGFGDTGSVGIGGITLGGGVGYLVRKYGLTIDDLLAADVVTADGELLRVDAETHPDLFWAIRGGGGNFGVATRFNYRLHDVGSIVGGMLMLPATAEVIQSFIALSEAAPEELSTIANVMPAPPMPFVPAEHHGELVIFGMLCYAGPVEAGERAVAPFRALATPIIDMVKAGRYPEMYPPDDENYHPIGTNRTMFIDSVDRNVGGDDPRAPRCDGRDDARGTAPRARRRDGASADRGHRIRAPQVADHGQRCRPLRTARSGRCLRAVGQRLRGGAETKRRGRVRQLPGRRGRGADSRCLPGEDLGPASLDQASLRSD